MKSIRLLLLLLLAVCCKANAQEPVDLGLSVCWASTNIGASSESSAGNYYLWNTSTPSKNWGNEWRLPTKVEVDELIGKCTWTKTAGGYKIKGPNGNEIFLPITGFKMDGASKTYSSSYMFYWTSTPSGGMSYALCDQGGVNCNMVYETDWTMMAIRPVCVKTVSGTHSGDLGLSVEWSLYNFNSSSAGDAGMIGPQRLANLNLTDGWRLPTEAEMQELIDNCTWTTATVGGYSVFKATAPNGNYVYFPKTGYMPSAGLDGRIVDSDYGYYWTSTSTGRDYYILKIQSANNVQIATLSNSYSAAIRAVKKTSAPTYTLDVSSTSLSFATGNNATGTIDISSNTSYSISADEPWIVLSRQDGTGNTTLSVTVNENATGKDRVGHITISSSTQSRTITITQNALKDEGGKDEGEKDDELKDAIYVWTEGSSTCYKLTEMPSVSYKDGKAVLTLAGSASPALVLELTGGAKLEITYGTYIPTAIENVEKESQIVKKVGKYIQGGRLVIIKDGKKYDIKGVEIKN